MSEAQEHDLWHKRIMEARKALGIGSIAIKTKPIEPLASEDVWIIGQDGTDA